MTKENFEFMLKRLREEFRYARISLNNHKGELFDECKTDKFMDFEERIELVRLQSQYEILQEIIHLTENEMYRIYGKPDIFGEVFDKKGE